MKNYRKVKDIYEVPCMRRLNGEKAISISGRIAIVQYADGARYYIKHPYLEQWDLFREEVFTNC